MRVEDRCFVELRSAIESSREIRKDVWSSFIIRRSAQKIVSSFSVQRLSGSRGDLCVVARGEGNENFQQIVLRQRQEPACRSQTCRLRSLAADDGLNDWICRCDFGAQREKLTGLIVEALG